MGSNTPTHLESCILMISLGASAHKVARHKVVDDTLLLIRNRSNLRNDVPRNDPSLTRTVHSVLAVQHHVYVVIKQLLDIDTHKTRFAETRVGV